VSVEIKEDLIKIDGGEFIISKGARFITIEHDLNANLNFALLEKDQLAQLITALQAMHDKMVDINKEE
jgi:hypothetical protein